MFFLGSAGCYLTADFSGISDSPNQPGGTAGTQAGGSAGQSMGGAGTAGFAGTGANHTGGSGTSGASGQSGNAGSGNSGNSGTAGTAGVNGDCCLGNTCNNGRCEPVVFATGAGSIPTSLALGGDYVYWAFEGDVFIYRARKDAPPMAPNAIKTVAQRANVGRMTQLKIHNQTLYWAETFTVAPGTSGARIMYAEIPESEPSSGELIAPNDIHELFSWSELEAPYGEVDSLFVSTTAVYWTVNYHGMNDHCSVNRWQFGQGQVENITPGSEAQVKPDVVANDEAAIWVEATQGQVLSYNLMKAPGFSADIQADSQTEPVRLTLVGNTICWVNNGSTDNTGSLVCSEIGNNTENDVRQQNLNQPFAITSSSGGVIWIDNNDTNSMPNQRIMLITNNNEVRELASRQQDTSDIVSISPDTSHPLGLAMDERAVFWTNTGETSLVKMGHCRCETSN